LPTRPAVPWQEVQSNTTSACPLMWPPPLTLIVPSWFTVFGWHWLQVAGVTAPVRVGCPAGGMPWQEPQPSGAPVQSGVAFRPETPLKVKLPWQ
jgi:hypothetical protein